MAIPKSSATLTPDLFSSGLPKLCQALGKALAEKGFALYAVGGFVRDALLNRQSNDIDLTTTADAETLLQALRQSNITNIDERGKAFGTVIARTSQGVLEISRLRRDGRYIDGRRPDTVEFISSVFADSERRDFTVNAIYYDFSKAKLLDPQGGIADLKAKRITAVGDPAIKFSEDALRIFRALKYAAKLDFQIENNTYEAMLQTATALSKISATRLSAEFAGFCKANNAAAYLPLAAPFLPYLFAVDAPYKVDVPYKNEDKTDDEFLPELQKIQILWSKSQNFLLRLSTLCLAFAETKTSAARENCLLKNINSSKEKLKSWGMQAHNRKALETLLESLCELQNFLSLNFNALKIIAKATEYTEYDEVHKSSAIAAKQGQLSLSQTIDEAHKSFANAAQQGQLSLSQTIVEAKLINLLLQLQTALQSHAEQKLALDFALKNISLSLNLCLLDYLKSVQRSGFKDLHALAVNGTTLLKMGIRPESIDFFKALLFAGVVLHKWQNTKTELAEAVEQIYALGCTRGSGCLDQFCQ